MFRLRFTYLFKVMMLVLLAGGIMSSCQRRHKLITQDEILLGATSVSTKALVENKQSLIDLSVDNHTGFGVFGYKTISSKNYTYRQFNNTLVYPGDKSASPTWSYAPRRYWDSDPEAAYQFAAYWPLLPGATPQAGGAYVTEAEKVLTINDVPNWQEQGGDSDLHDILVAAKRGRYKDANGQPTADFPGNYVNFSFKHILANIILRGYYIGIKENPVNVLEMKLRGTNMLTTDGSADYVFPFAGQDNVTEGFTSITNGNSTHTLLPSTSPVSLPQESWYNDNDAEPNTYVYTPICSWLTVPSTGWQGLELVVKYSLGDLNATPAPTPIEAAPVQIALNTTVGDQTHAGTTLPQYRYLVTLKFNSANKGIEVESVQVAQWNEIEINPGVYNW